MKQFFLHIFLCLFLGSITQPVLASQDKARVMVVHSYGSNHICGAPQAIGVVAGLAKQGWEEGNNLYLESFYMDTKKTYTTPAAIKQRGKLALDAIDTFGPDVVIVLDDNAIREVMLPLVGNPKISLVFSGMNGQPENYNNKKAFMDSRSAPGSNVTGVYEKLHVYKSLMVMSAALGGAQVHHPDQRGVHPGLREADRPGGGRAGGPAVPPGQGRPGGRSGGCRF